MTTFRQWLGAGAPGMGGASFSSSAQYGTMKSPQNYIDHTLRHFGNDGKNAQGQSTNLYQDYTAWLVSQLPTKEKETPPDPIDTANGGKSSAQALADQRSLEICRSILDSLGKREQDSAAQINKNFDTSLASLTGERDRAYQNLDREQGKLDNQKTKSLGQLGNDIRNLLQGANTQLGMYGAGNSSAADMSAYGASDLANKTSADIGDQYNEQSGDISLNRDHFKSKYDEENRRLTDDRQNKLREMKDTYNDTRTDLQTKIANTTTDHGEAQRNINSIRDRYNTSTAPNYSYGDLKPYEAKGVSSADITGGVSGPTLSQSQAQQFFNVPADKKKTK